MSDSRWDPSLDRSVVHLDPQTAMFEAMLRGWGQQQSSRSLSVTTIRMRLEVVRRFSAYTQDWPWRWTAGDVEDWSSALRSGAKPLAHSTIRGYQNAVAMFCEHLIDPRYPWVEECLARFGAHPTQVCHEWNTTRHTSEFEGRPVVRPFARAELQQFFDFADEMVGRALRLGRTGWVAAFRDATLFKVIYAYGPRRREAVMLDVGDFSRNPKAAEFGEFGACNVRYGKAARGSPPRRRTVLTVMPWSVPVLREYLEEIRLLYPVGGQPYLWPTERGGRISPHYVSLRFAEYRDAAGLPEELHPHCLRHSYITHLIEDGFDALFVQQQVGHAWGSTTALYTGVSGEFRNRVLRQALDRGLGEELSTWRG